MDIITMKLDELVPYENNPRNNDDAVGAVANSIREFGFKVPIIVDKDNVIVAGHTRLRAAQLLGLKDVPVIRADDLSEEQVRAFRLADNKTAELADWDFAKLEQELDGLSINMDQFGFETDDLPSDDELDAIDVKPTNPITIKITFKKKADMQKIENDLREYLDGIEGAAVVVGGGLGGDYE